MNNQPLSSGIVLHNFIIPAPGVPKTVLYHFSDIHLTVFDALSDDAEREQAIQGSSRWNQTRRYFAEKNGEPLETAQQLDAAAHLSRLLHLSEAGDALILAGDIFDCVSPANLRALESALQNHPTPVLFVCGNHEDPAQIPEDLCFSSVKNPVQILDLPGLILVGLDNSRRCITAEQTAQLQALLAGDKPLIIAMHIPIMADSNRALLEPCGEYFRLNHSEADRETLRFVELVQRNPGKILAVLAGHLHFSCTSELAPGISQYVSSQGILGNINRYEIGE